SAWSRTTRNTSKATPTRSRAWCSRPVSCARPEAMKTPEPLRVLIDDGVIDEVVRPLKSGKEAAVYVVRAHGETLCAKVYKDMAQRSFQQRVQYQEGRK